MVSTIVDKLLHVYDKKSENEALAYFYCDRNQDDYRNSMCILSSFIRQLALPSYGNEIREQALQIYEEKSRDGFASNKMTCEEVEMQLQALVQDYSQTTLVLDALDECDKETLVYLTRYLGRLVRHSPGVVKILVSSRPDPDIRLEFEDWPSIEITSADNHDDIVTYLNKAIADSGTPHFWRNMISDQLKERIRTTLIGNAEGMYVSILLLASFLICSSHAYAYLRLCRFQWVVLQIRHLHTLSRERDIETLLGKLPQTLKEAYDEIFGRIQLAGGSAPEVAARAFQWMMCSRRPLSPTMLVAAVCQDPTTNNVDLVDIDIDFVLEACQNLLTIDSSGQACRFSHLSVREYLETNRWNAQQANCLLAKVCLRYLNSQTQESLDTYKMRPTEHRRWALAEYANNYWIIHIQLHGRGQPDGRLVCLLKQFLGSPVESSSAYKLWLHICGSDRNSKIFTIHRRYLPRHKLSMFLEPDTEVSRPIALFGLHDILSDWWQALDLKEGNFGGNTLLTVASTGGCVATVKSLLENGACGDVRSSSRSNHNALYQSAMFRDCAITTLLLDAGMDVNIEGGIYGNALQKALVFGHEATVKLLLKRGANVNAQGGEYGTALQAAFHTTRGSITLVQLLLQADAVSIFCLLNTTSSLLFISSFRSYRSSSPSCLTITVL